MGGFRKNGVPHYGRGTKISLLAELYRFRIWAESRQHFVYLQIGYQHRCSVLNVKIFSDGSGDYLDRRVSVIGWDRSESFRQWQSELFDAFSRNDAWLLDVPIEVIEPNVVKGLHDQLRTFAFI